MNIEEGVATLFSTTASGIPEWYAAQARASHPAYYRDAVADVRQLLALNDEAIKVLRAHTPQFHQMTAELLVDIFGAPLDLAMRLCTRRPTEILR